MTSKWATIAAQQGNPQQQQGRWAEKAKKTAIPEAENELEWGSVLTKAVMNAPESAANYAKNIYTAIRHPIDTASAVGRVVTGSLYDPNYKESPGDGLGGVLQKGLKDFGGEENQQFSLQKAMKARYGSVDALKESIAYDPVGTLADVSSVLYPMGKGAGAVGMTKTSNFMMKASTLTDPISASIAIPKKGASLLIPKTAPSRLYESAVKLSTVLPIKQRGKIVRTALDNQIMPTYSGLTKLNGKIDVLNSKISNTIDTAAKSGRTIPLDDLFKNFDDLQEEILKISGEPIKGFEAFDKVKKEITLANELLDRTRLTPRQAQDMKVRIYKELDNEYSRVALHPISKEAQMAVASNIKTAIEEIVPEIKQLNAEDGALLELRKAITRPIERISNRDLLSLGATAKGAAGGVIAGPSGLAAGLALGLLDSQPIIKAKLALVLNSLKKNGIKVRPTVLGSRLGLYQAGKTYEKENEPLPTP